MKFSKYMNEWLYGNDGYYATYKEIGKGGDFYTSVSTSKFFGGSIAKHIISLVDDGFLDKDGVVCEIGAHHGYLLADICEFIYTLRPQLLSTLKFVIIERFDNLQQYQKDYFAKSFSNAVNLQHYKSLNELKCNSAFFVANEIFDAFGCELFYNGKIAEVKDGKIEFVLDDEWVSKKAKKYKKDKGEIAIGYEEFAKEMASSSKRFEFMSFDYGEMEARFDFSLRIYTKHKVFPFFEDGLDYDELFKKSDLTYDVTFEHVKDAFEEAGVEFIELKTQMVALVDMGILELLEILKDKAGDKIYSQELEKVKMLIMPNFFGERFKMVRFRKS